MTPRVLQDFWADLSRDWQKAEADLGAGFCLPMGRLLVPRQSVVHRFHGLGDRVGDQRSVSCKPKGEMDCAGCLMQRVKDFAEWSLIF